MPNTWRKARLSSAISRLLCNIRSKRGGSSPLLVQTGFPTSLADIVVKNRSRLKKPKPGSRSHNAPSDSFGCRVSGIISAVELRGEQRALSELVPGDDEIAQEEEDRSIHFRHEIDGMDQHTARLPLLADSDGPVEDNAPLATAASTTGGRTFAIRAKRAVAILVLAACSICASKGLVLGIMTAAIGLLLLEPVLSRLLPRTRMTGDVTNANEAAIDVDGGGVHPSGSGRICEVNDVDCERTSNALDLDESKAAPDAGLGYAKTKKNNREKQMADKLPHSQGPAQDSDDDSFYLPSSPRKEINAVGGQLATTSNDLQIVSVRPKYLVLIVIVLSGLIVGRVPALGLTVAWWYLVKFTGGSLVPGMFVANKRR